tara:strand:+ start:185 stop:1408 length:1224 start_codon:yes stop_codon:yes gene_type:complete
MNNIVNFIIEFWLLLNEMSPYLLFGFLIAGILSVIISPEIVQKNLGGKGFGPIFKASLFGIPLPLCSCGVIPVASSLYNRGASKSSTTSFLISTPQTGIDSIMVTYSMLGPIFAIFRPIVALITGILGGSLVALIGEEKENININQDKDKIIDKKSIIKKIFNYGFVSLPQDIGKPLIIGVLLAALISMLIPDDFFAGYIGNGIFGMLFMMLMSIPLYICATASVPIAVVLMLKGVSPGAALVFLMAGPATNTATIGTIWKVLGKKTALIYLFSVGICSIIFGLILNQFTVDRDINFHSHQHLFSDSIINDITSIILILVFIFSTIKLYSKNINKKGKNNEPKIILNIEGMTCNNCSKTVKNAIIENENVMDTFVDHISGKAEIMGDDINIEEVISKIESYGFVVNK